VARCDALGVPPYSAEPDMLFRAYLTPAYAAAQAVVGGWMLEAGMAVHTDPAANLVGRYDGTDDLPPLIIGSHLDSVRDGGRYDGPLGVMLAIEAVAALHAAGRRMRFPIEVYGFGDEEGSRFPASMLTSRVVAGVLESVDPGITDRDGVTLEEAMHRYRHPSASADLSPLGVLLSFAPSFAGVTDMGRARHGPALAYLEAHIEQGPVLEAEGLGLGVVTGIAAQLRFEIAAEGTAGHAGTTTMTLRRDALAGAAEMALAAERIAREAASDVVATVGRFNISPNAPNVIPGAATFTLDVRSLDLERRNRAADAILAEMRAIADRRSLDFVARQQNDLSPSPCNPMLMDLLEDAIADLGQPRFRLPSGAGHDAMVMAALCPTAMLFVRCRGGISHNPAEHVEPGDAELALQAMLGFIDRLGETLEP
jgi:allantoate deiminase